VPVHQLKNAHSAKSTGQIIALFGWIQILTSHKILLQQQQQHVN
jgi:hypothetical protein